MQSHHGVSPRRPHGLRQRIWRREAVWPRGIVGSIARTRDFASAVAIRGSDCAAFGIGSEALPDAAMCDTIATSCLTRLGLKRVLRGSEGNRRLSSTTIFCIKEALYKAAYPRLRRFSDFEELEVLRLDRSSGYALGGHAGRLLMEGNFERVATAFVSWIVTSTPLSR